MKPEASILNIIKNISQASNVKVLKKSSIYSFLQNEEPVTFILHSGKAKVYRDTDSMLMTTLVAPMLIGGNLLYNEAANFYIQVDQPVEYEIIALSKIEGLYDEHRLWKDVALLFMHITAMLTHELYSTSKVSAYDMVKSSLNELISRKNSLSINACEYIMERTLLSRSTVMKMLKELREGEYIDIRRGVLIAVYKLPDKF